VSPTTGATYPNFSVKIEMEEFDEIGFSFSTESVPDEDWRFIDKEGHGHFWKGRSLPTLDKIEVGKHWIGDEYDGQEVSEWEHRCRLCAEKVEPKFKNVPIKRPPPMLKWFIVGIGSEEFHLTPEQYADGLECMASYWRTRGWE
jgi:hypothetical protein